MSQVELREKLSFRSERYTYSNRPPSESGHGRFACELRSPYGDEGHNPIIRIEFNDSELTKQPIVSPDGGFVRFEINGKEGQGEGWKLGANNLAWLYPDGMVLRFSYYDWVGSPPYLTSEQEAFFLKIFSKLIDEVPEYNETAGTFSNTKVG